MYTKLAQRAIIGTRTHRHSLALSLTYIHIQRLRGRGEEKRREEKRREGKRGRGAYKHTQTHSHRVHSLAAVYNGQLEGVYSDEREREKERRRAG